MGFEFEIIRTDNGRAQLGESPVWDAGTSCIWWVDVTGKRLFRTDPDQRTTRVWDTPECPGFVVLTGADRAVVGMQTGIYAFEPHNSSFSQLIAFGQVGHRFNDATVDQSGRLWTSTMALDAQKGVAGIQYVSSDMQLIPVVRGLSIPNGMAVNLSTDTLYYSDSHPDVQTVWHRPLSGPASVAGDDEVLAALHDLPGRPDGAALDRDGNYWIAGVDGGELYEFAAGGTLVGATPLPMPAPTKLVFFGTDGRRVALTSKAVGDAGGYLAIADAPANHPSGQVQPFWAPGA